MLKQEFEALAKYEVSQEVFEAINKLYMNCDLDKCICEPNNPERGCISPKCMKEIMETGQCHCRMYRKG